MIRKTTKALAGLSAVAMCFSLIAGCGGDTSSADPDITQSTESIDSDNTVDTIDTGWTYGQVAVGGGGFVTGVFSTCEEGVYYARTDVGGAYRWNDNEQQWKSLNYWVSEEDVGLMGISAIAVDPNNAARVFLLAGTEYFSGGKTCILISDNYGESFDVVEVSDLIKVHGNGMGRGNGERIAIDPHNPDIIYAGGNSGGMIKSTDGGYTWESVTSFPVTTTPNRNGINIIVLDPKSVKDGVTQRIYAAVSANSNNIYVSEDAGSTWELLPNAHKAMPQRIKLDSNSNLYVAYGDTEGPWGMSSGSVYKYDIAAGTAENIAPATTPFSDIAIDPNNEDRLVVTTACTWSQQPNGSFGDIIYVSSDGGESWKNIIENATMSNNGMDWIDGYAFHWCSSLALNPFDTDEIMVTSGNGVFACDNIWDDSPELYFNAKGIEETVPMDMITLEDFPLVSGALDYDGYVHNDIHISAARHGGQIGSVTSITIAPQNRDYWAKVGGSESSMALTYTTDGGKTWTPINKPPEKGKVYYNGKLAFNADGSRLIWSPENSLSAFYTEDFGETWTKCEGLVGQNTYIIGDSVNPDYVYAYGNDKVYRSSDGGKSFEKIAVELFTMEDRLCVDPVTEGKFYLPAGGGLYVTSDHGDTFTRIDGVVMCGAVSLGKAKNEGDPYVIYIYGTTADNDTSGIYMSEDNGATWQRVNDDAHRFGGLGNGDWICGDLNVYGRVYMSTVGLGICYCDKTEK